MHDSDPTKTKLLDSDLTDSDPEPDESKLKVSVSGSDPMNPESDADFVHGNSEPDMGC